MAASSVSIKPQVLEPEIQNEVVGGTVLPLEALVEKRTPRLFLHLEAPAFPVPHSIVCLHLHMASRSCLLFLSLVRTLITD